MMPEIAMQELQQELRRLQDVEAIRRLLIEYGRTLDRRDFAAYSSLFAVDGEWVGIGTIGGARGPAAIKAFMEKNIGVELVRCNHLMTNMLIDVDGDSATAWSRWTLIDAAANDTPALIYSGHYDDLLTRQHGEWKFRRRLASVDIPDVSQPPPGLQR
jgi:ketosteroid isomerase-like protein